MLTSHASWKVLFYSIATVNESGDQNVTGFTGAMYFEASLEVKMRMLDQPYGFLLAANEKKGVSILHHPHNFGGTLLRPTNKVGCLVGIGPSAVPVIVDHIAALRSTRVIVPSIEDIAGCPTANDLAALPPPLPTAAASLTSRRSRASSPLLSFATRSSCAHPCR
jgi:hypothetical protein